MVLKNDIHYIDNILKGDQKAFKTLVLRYQDFVYHIAFKIVKNEMDAEEVAQDAFMKAYKGLKGFSRKSKFSSWLYKITYYTAISKTRSNQRKWKHLSMDDEQIGLQLRDPGELISDLVESEQIRFINLALESLAESTQIVLHLFYLKECSIKEIIEITGISQSNIKTHLYRGRKKMLEELENLLKNEMRSII